jgi:23S rRNA (adenine1618-N6)-methyltransferase
MPSNLAKPNAPKLRKATAGKNPFHPRNRHQGHYDFPAMIKQCPELGAFVITNPYGNLSIDFANPEAVRVLNRALLKILYRVDHWDIPPGYLCPPVPGRADYIHGLADLLADDHAGVIPRGPSVRALDVGVGANCIYPLLGHLDYGWQFVASDTDLAALANAEKIRADNPALAEGLILRHQADTKSIFHGVIQPGERFAVTMCNPPFHSSAAQAASGSVRKWRNLGKLDPSRKLPKLNFGGQFHELCCAGGEPAFLRRMVTESVQYGAQVNWFTSLVSKAGNLTNVQAQLQKNGALDVRIGRMAQGQKQSRFLAWTFLDLAQRAQRARRRWSAI